MLDVLEREFAYSFGGCTLVSGLEGSYLSRIGSVMRDRVNLLYSDTPFTFEANLPRCPVTRINYGSRLWMRWMRKRS